MLLNKATDYSLLVQTAGLSNEDDVIEVEANIVLFMCELEERSQLIQRHITKSAEADAERARTKFQGVLTHELLINTVKYDSVTGVFTNQGEEGFFNEPAAHVEGGMLMVNLFGTNYVAQSLAWFYLTGEWPSPGIRAVDGDWLNARMNNLVLKENPS